MAAVKARPALLLVLAAFPQVMGLASDASLTSALERDQELKERPVAKVVRMLKEMLAELNAELEDDKAVYELLKCWCETNEKEKTKAIEEGEARIAALEADLGEFAAQMKEIKSKLAATKAEVNSDWEALNKASGMRMEQSKEFHGEETDLITAIKSAEQAIVVLSKHHPDFMQVRSAARSLQGLPSQLLSKVLDASQIAVLKSFFRQAESHDSFLSGTIPGMQSYAPQSGQIFGILKQLKEDLEGDLSEAQAAEKKAKEEYETLKAAKEEEQALGKKQIAQLEEDLANFGEKAAQAMKELEDTEEQLALDKEFLANLRKRCENIDKEFAERTKSRLEEIAAVQDTIKFLNSDEAYNMFTKTVNTGFVQKSASSSSVHGKEQQQRLRDRAVAVLAHAASQTGAPQLALVMTSVRLDAFTKVKELIDKMIEELNKQQKDEIEQRDWCIAELNKNNRTLEAKYDLQADLLTKKADLEATIETLTKTIEEHKATIEEMQTQMKRASEDREADNGDFQQTVSDQRITQAILKKALERMQQVYALMQKPGAPHIQTSATHTDPGNGPARFTKMEKNAGGSKIVAMISSIIADSQKLEAEAIAAEQDSQTAYDNFMQESNESMTKLLEAITNMSESKAKAKEELNLTKTDLDTTNNELKDLHDTEADLHNSCDYLLKNFFVRQDARAQEIDALKEAKAILSGMK